MRKHKLLGLAIVATVFGLGHHVDHVIRGNHVGWPLSPEPTPFTYSLGFYPVIAAGLYLYWTGRVGPGFWAVVAAAGFFFVGLLHFGPFAVEPPADILGPYESPVAGWLALSWLVMFLSVLAGVAVYAGYLWARQRGKANGPRA